MHSAHGNGKGGMERVALYARKRQKGDIAAPTHGCERHSFIGYVHEVLPLVISLGGSAEELLGADNTCVCIACLLLPQLQPASCANVAPISNPGQKYKCPGFREFDPEKSALEAPSADRCCSKVRAGLRMGWEGREGGGG